MKAHHVMHSILSMGAIILILCLAASCGVPKERTKPASEMEVHRLHSLPLPQQDALQGVETGSGAARHSSPARSGRTAARWAGAGAPPVDRPEAAESPQAEPPQRGTSALRPLSQPAPKKPPIEVKGIYVSGHSAGGTEMEHLIRLADRTEINAMVIDVKNDWGQMTYSSDVPMARQIGADRHVSIPDIQQLMDRLKKHHIYTIGRIVTFKDQTLASNRPDLAMHNRSGQVWKDDKGTMWVDPYRTEVQDYNIALAEEAARKGFDEIQFDYVRFPANGQKVDRVVRFHNPEQLSKAELIARFLNRAHDALHALDRPISADVFGLTTSTPDDMGIGQQWGEITRAVDYISPMIYPSHYSDGNYGIIHPDLHPYAIVKKAIADALGKNKQVGSYSPHTAVIRPWLQDFTAAWVHPHLQYGNAQVREQIRAAEEQGVRQYLLWNASNRYSIQ